jgi:hypothetical protein
MGGRSRTVQRRFGALAAVLSLGLATPLRVAGHSAEAGPLPVPLTLAASVHAARADLSLAVQDATAPAPPEESPKAFFKSRRGVVTVVLMAAGLGWVFYSKSHDRVRSPANQ